MRAVTVIVSLAAGVAALRRGEELTFGEYFLQNIIMILGSSVLVLVFLWCLCSIYAGRADRKAQELRRLNRQEQENEELTIQTSLYNRQEDQQRKILQIL